MTKPENRQIENQQSTGLLQVPESELTNLLKTAEALEAILRRVPLLKPGFVEEGAPAQNLMKMSNVELTRRLTVRLANHTLNPLHNWDNEGGSPGGIPFELEPIWWTA